VVALAKTTNQPALQPSTPATSVIKIKPHSLR
jgi:hypothetical protein